MRVRWDFTFEATDTDNWESLFELHKNDFHILRKMKEALKNLVPPSEYKKQQYELFKIKHPELF
jgi:hypothetical protein